MADEPVALDAPSLSELVDDIAADGHGLVMLMGKGGVGKTTLAAAVAVELARRGLPVHLTTSDPAAHLAETLHGSMSNLTVSRIDPHAETERYRQEVLADQGREARRPRARAARRRSALALHRGNRRFPGLLAHHSRGGRKVRGDGHRADRPHLAAAGRDGRLSPRSRAAGRTQGRAFHDADDAVAGSEADQGAARHLGGNDARARSGQSASRLASRRHRAMGVDHQQQRCGGATAFASAAQRARNELREVEAVATIYARRYAVVPLLREEPVGVHRLLELAGRVSEAA